jgi:hypothetical protein
VGLQEWMSEKRSVTVRIDIQLKSRCHCIAHTTRIAAQALRLIGVRSRPAHENLRPFLSQSNFLLSHCASCCAHGVLDSVSSSMVNRPATRVHSRTAVSTSAGPGPRSQAHPKKSLRGASGTKRLIEEVAHGTDASLRSRRKLHQTPPSAISTTSL